MNSESSLSHEIKNNISEKTFNELDLNSNLISHSNSNSIVLTITHKTQIINNNNNVLINSEDSFLNLLDNLKKSKKLDYKQFYYEVKKIVMEESSNENEYEIYTVLKKVKEMAKTIKQIKKKETKNMENILGVNMEEQNNIKNKSIKIIKIDTIDNFNKDKKLSNNNSYNCEINDYLPELLSPENNYKAFINSIKQFEYEEKIYDKYLTIEDLKILKSFPEKLNKYLAHLKTFKRKKK